MVNLTIYNKPPPSNKPPGGLIEIQGKDENETVFNKPQGVNENNSLFWSAIEIHIFSMLKNFTKNKK